MAVDSMFAPLTADEAIAETSTTAPKPKLTPIRPVPDDAPPCRWRHPVYGEPAAMWAYRDAEGRLIGFAARLEFLVANGERKKSFYPVTYCKVEDGERSYFAWRSGGLPEPRPLYNLPQLLASPAAPVIITEGEKTADAAAALFAGYIGITSMGGAHAAEKTDWSSLKGRVVVIWPDNDEPGRDYAVAVIELVVAAGAKSVATVNVPDDWPDGWDLADPLPDGVGREMLGELLKTAISPPAYISFDKYRMTGTGLYLDDPDGPSAWLCAPFEVVAQTRDTNGYAWGLLLRWRDPDDRVHEWAMPWRALAGTRDEVWRE
ncbi:MAG TPA: DUF927 domain-containing protein, partial [Stellaceae bacterium]|nr:DUF927 domain-containing protein [Stellaceae bacterium]